MKRIKDIIISVVIFLICVIGLNIMPIVIFTILNSYLVLFFSYLITLPVSFIYLMLIMIYYRQGDDGTFER